MFKLEGGVRWITAAWVVCLLPVAALGADETVRVGVLGQRVGSSPSLGRVYEEAITLASEAINEEQGGILGKRLEVILEDSGASPERASGALHRLIMVEGVVLSVGETQSQSALAETEIAEQYRHPLIVAEALADDVTAKNCRYVFRAGPCHSGIIEDTFMSFVLESGFQRIAMIVEDTDFGQNAAALLDRKLRSHGLPVLPVALPRGNMELTGMVRNLKEYAPDLILVLHYGVDLGAVAAQLQAAGFRSPLPILVSGPSLAGMWESGVDPGQDISQIILRAGRLHPDVDETAESQKLRRAYRQRFNKELTDYRVRSVYDVLMIAADALRRAGGGDSERLVAALEQTHLAVAGGVVRFGMETGSYRYHHWQPPVLLVQWQDRRSTVIFPRTLATGMLLR